ncbi:MAG TPA: tRNA uracil 4-sulfurtransferase ThiI [Myxococcota bacterium]|nr:tRNA uracil 4-sulfurtransferase ThiI [Myxococcota bacterium]HOD08008.1 tRNA uracil 4-sulfurtransferase ThiI [Myxococcota bacterium]
MTVNAVLVTFSEVFLKRGKRPWFLSKLKEGLERQLAGAGRFRVRELYSMLMIVHADSKGWDLVDFVVDDGLITAFGRSFGIVSFMPSKIVPREISIMEKEMEEIADSMMQGVSSFKVETVRSVKDFPLNSMELSKRLGGVIWEKTKTPVKMKDPELTINVRILPAAAAISVRSIRGPGGLPTGSSGKTLLMLSGGIDSPVAGYQVMRRGCSMDAVHFDASPYTTPEAREKVEKLAQMLAAYQPGMNLYVVPFGSVQAHLRDSAPGRMLVVLYRRMMLRCASKIAERANALAIVTGDNIGQVASQTLENMTVIGQATGMTVLRPLLTYDKMDVVDVARRIGTFDTSILPFDDCCSLFVPPHPETAADLERVLAIESEIDINALVDMAVSESECLRIGEPEARH